MTEQFDLARGRHSEVSLMPQLHDALLRAGAAHGLEPFGLYALDSLRMDKCHRAWKQDIEIGCSPLEAGLERFVDFEKPGFMGKDSLLTQRQRGVARRLVPLVLDDPGGRCSRQQPRIRRRRAGRPHDLGGLEPLASAKHRTGLCTGRRRSARTTARDRRAGPALPRRVKRQPLFDPDNARQRA
jgi:dimethylglycine dehydrogenase